MSTKEITINGPLTAKVCRAAIKADEIQRTTNQALTSSNANRASIASQALSEADLLIETFIADLTRIQRTAERSQTRLNRQGPSRQNNVKSTAPKAEKAAPKAQLTQKAATPAATKSEVKKSSEQKVPKKAQPKPAAANSKKPETTDAKTDLAS